VEIDQTVVVEVELLLKEKMEERVMVVLDKLLQLIVPYMLVAEVAEVQEVLHLAVVVLAVLLLVFLEQVVLEALTLEVVEVDIDMPLVVMEPLVVMVDQE
jgi:hypothetical protein